MPIDRKFEALVYDYLRDVLDSHNDRKGWKLPETTLAYPWLVRMFPAASYVHIVRDPRDALLKSHITDDLRKGGVDFPAIDDMLERRVASWKYQHEIVKATPQPKRFFPIRYEDLVLDHEASMQRLEAFLEMPLARVVVDPSRVGRWRSDPRLLPHIEPLEDDLHECGYE